MNYKCHYDIASVMFADEYISTSFKYDEDKSKWFYKDMDDIWNEDKDLKKLKYEITTRGFDKFIKKYEMVNESNDQPKPTNLKSKQAPNDRYCSRYIGNHQDQNLQGIGL